MYIFCVTFVYFSSNFFYIFGLTTAAPSLRTDSPNMVIYNKSFTCNSSNVPITATGSTSDIRAPNIIKSKKPTGKENNPVNPIAHKENPEKLRN